MTARPSTQPVLPRVRIVEHADHSFTTTVDGHGPAPAATRAATAGVDPWRPARDLATDTGLSVFAELTDVGGETFTHVFDPYVPRATSAVCGPDVPLPPEAPALTGPSRPARPGPDARHPEAGARQAAPRAGVSSWPAAPPFSVSAGGFTPGEDVYVAVVVSTRTARPDGVARLPLPGALLGRLPGVLIVFGPDSGTLVVADPTAATPPATATDPRTRAA